MPLRLGVLASGRGSNLQAIIDSIENKKLDATITIIVSNKSDAQALERAQQHGIKGMYLNPKSVIGESDPRKAYDQKILEVLKAHEVQLVLLAGYMKIVTSVLIEAYQWRMMNIHPSLLPSFPGLNGQQQALDAGVKISGCTVHFVTEGVDEGPIILQAAVPVHEGDSVDSLSARILEQEHRLYPQAVALFAAGRLSVEGQKTKILEPAS
ncbi:phosphoribosylglycinamide formyltransferase [Candidatus Nitronereus thalassa]|uniref:Phosphoribosylglycinamide formyltransferase n=1 Tax=Candidatus Nitronereus thalassa TaxID=3020898 RepID=A0ABU3K4A5_9BACT|nr:phosphoribosylglycinamide formyltransferase [Candidatus Nitronereus thalassa]MDT7041224.1 phosphoribosylglycinamide formyltransferase [Candidatus Nitronereus thalassa]